MTEWFEEPQVAWNHATGKRQQRKIEILRKIDELYDYVDLERWENEGGAVIERVIRRLEEELDSIGQYAETEGVDWCNGAVYGLKGALHILRGME